MTIHSKNPATEEVIESFTSLSENEIEQKLKLSEEAFISWSSTSFSERSSFLKKAASILRDDKKYFAKLATLEMGKPIVASLAEVEKCALICDYYADNAEDFLKPEIVKTDASESSVNFEPLGSVLAVMPWNFPYWQVMRFAAPLVMAGNVGLLKHASNVPQVSNSIEELFIRAGFPKGVFQSLQIGASQVENIIRDSRIKAVTLTGSEYAGSQVAKTAGEEIKKTVLELGGSDPFIIFEDAEVPKACDSAVIGRLQNAGQSCIAAKRFIVVESKAEEFISLMKKNFEAQIIGDPLNEKTQMGPLATESILKDIKEQVNDAVKKGAEVVTGGESYGDKGYFYKPTILTNITKDMRVYSEETFGPVATIFVVKTEDEAITLANDTEFGLGASLWTKDIKKAKKYIPKLRVGSVFVNGFVKSDPRLPFGGVGKSGYGRELSHYGIKEFVNIKTVWIK